MKRFPTPENRFGNPIQAGKYRIIPIEQRWRAQSPGMRFFAFWRRPASVLVLHPDGGEEIIEIPDVTRQAQIAIWGLALLIPFLIWGFRQWQSNNE
ncbi:MAG TPA: hypothetical protein EYP88_03625 [Anaerolineales bacterium]|nr:hypothetical protein [Anaerolineales bacterium]